MKANELKCGDTVDGWTVTDIYPNAEASFWYGDGEDGEFTSDVVILLTLERKPPWLEPHHNQNERETRRDWYREDEEVQP